jgi:glutaminyl-peptide cyclotransferase
MWAAVFLACLFCLSSAAQDAAVSDVVAYPLSRARLTSIASVPFDQVHADTLALAIPRVPSTAGSVTVREYIKRQLPSAFTVTEDSFTQQTLLGPKSFVNVVATLSVGMSRPRRVVLAAHYDSKLLDNFVGATDSAVPCAMLLDLARMVVASDVSSLSWGLQLIFFDGEEAFNTWTATDSLYGSRHLASLWESEGSSSANALQKISLFVLFDLVGAVDNKFYNFFPQTSLQFKVFRNTEASLLF